MNPRQINAALKKLVGPKSGYRRNAGAPDASERAIAAELAADLLPRLEAAKAARDARYNELMRDPEYRALCGAHKAIEAQRNDQLGIARRYAITVGKTVGDLFFEVLAEGDTWPEVLRTLEGRKRAGF